HRRSQQHLQDLGHHLRPRGRPDELAPAPLHRQSQHALHVLPPARGELLPQPLRAPPSLPGILIMSAAALQRADSVVHTLGLRSPEPPGWRTLVACICIAGPLYGAFMGSYAFESGPDRLLMVLYAAIKMPLLILVTSALCLPAFFVLTTVLGLRDD